MSTASIKAIIAARDNQIVDDSQLDSLVELASTQLDSGIFGTSYNYAVALLVLHWYAKTPSLMGGDAGGVIREREGDLEREYVRQTLTVNDDYDTTGYGRELKGVMNTYTAQFRGGTRAAGYV